MNIFLLLLSGLLLCFTLLSVIKYQYWVFRVFDYPRLQKLVASVVCLVLFTFFYEGTAAVYWSVLAALAVNIIYLASQILPFTPIGSKQVKKGRAAQTG